MRDPNMGYGRKLRQEMGMQSGHPVRTTEAMVTGTTATSRVQGPLSLCQTKAQIPMKRFSE